MENHSFFNREKVVLSEIKVNGGIPIGIEMVRNENLGINGAYAAWGASYSNEQLPALVSDRLHADFPREEAMNLDELGFLSRHHVPRLNPSDNKEVEIEVGARLIAAALIANQWNAEEVDGIFIGTSGPICEDYLPIISKKAGLREDVLKVDIHKACDGSMGALQLVMNENIGNTGPINIAKAMRGKKVLVGGIEGLSRFTCESMDKNALQLFGNGAGIFGFIPEKSMKFLVGRSSENFDEEGLLQVRMFYPHSKQRVEGKTLVEVSQESADHYRVAGLMHEPENGMPILMAGLMGMVKLFVRNGVLAVTDVYNDYLLLMNKRGTPDKQIDMGIVHHANYKINQLKAKHLLKEGISYPMPWLLNDFGNVSAASCVIAFLRQLPQIKSGDHVLFDGFGAGSYYDVIIAEMAG